MPEARAGQAEKHARHAGLQRAARTAHSRPQDRPLRFRPDLAAGASLELEVRSDEHWLPVHSIQELVTRERAHHAERIANGVQQEFRALDPVDFRLVVHYSDGAGKRYESATTVYYQPGPATAIPDYLPITVIAT